MRAELATKKVFLSSTEKTKRKWNLHKINALGFCLRFDKIHHRVTELKSINLL